MGADNSVLEGCEWGEDVSECNLNWSLQHATAKDGRQVTVFHPKKGERKYHDMLERLAQVRDCRFILIQNLTWKVKHFFWIWYFSLFQDSKYYECNVCHMYKKICCGHVIFICIGVQVSR